MGARAASSESIPSGLQGNVVAPHRRAYALHLFLRFPARGSRSSIHHWMRSVSRRLISNARDEHALEAGRPRPLFGSLLLSASGYRNLALEAPDGGEAFAGGMKKRHEMLDDPDPAGWQPLFRLDLDALLILAHDDEAMLWGVALNERDRLRRIGVTVAGIEPGYQLRSLDGIVDNYGYKDGVNTLAHPPDDIGGLRSRLLAPHLEASPSGSYLVFRKLEQNVVLWRSELARFAVETGVPATLAGAYAIGRFSDGTPVSVSDRPLGLPIRTVSYGNDPYGIRCPYNAHARLASPRGGPRNAKVVVARRGMAYGNRPDLDRGSGTAPPVGGVGLLFMCYQRDIAAQFEMLQRQANGAADIGPGVVDPLIGQGPRRAQPTEWPGGAGRTHEFCFAPTVTTVGGEYFHAPSKHFLESL